jgi:hypothetical protein
MEGIKRIAIGMQNGREKTSRTFVPAAAGFPKRIFKGKKEILEKEKNFLDNYCGTAVMCSADMRGGNKCLPSPLKGGFNHGSGVHHQRA